MTTYLHTMEQLLDDINSHLYYALDSSAVIHKYIENEVLPRSGKTSSEKLNLIKEYDEIMKNINETVAYLQKIIHDFKTNYTKYLEQKEEP